MAAECTRRLIGFYDKREVGDPAARASGIAAVFTDYPAFVAYLACDPRQGLPSRHRFLPAIAEVKVFCEEVTRGRNQQQQQAQQIISQLAERKRLPGPSDFPEFREKVVEARLAQLGPKFGIETPAEKAVSIPPLETVMAKYPGGVMAGLKLSPETMKTMAVQETLARLRELAVADDGDAD